MSQASEVFSPQVLPARTFMTVHCTNLIYHVMMLHQLSSTDQNISNGRYVAGVRFPANNCKNDTIIMVLPPQKNPLPLF
jgi:hypothetical protein